MSCVLCRDCSPDCLVAVILALRTAIYLPDDWVVRKGEVSILSLLSSLLPLLSSLSPHLSLLHYLFSSLFKLIYVVVGLN